MVLRTNHTFDFSILKSLIWTILVSVTIEWVLTQPSHILHLEAMKALGIV